MMYKSWSESIEKAIEKVINGIICEEIEKLVENSKCTMTKKVALIDLMNISYEEIDCAKKTMDENENYIELIFLGGEGVESISRILEMPENGMMSYLIGYMDYLHGICTLAEKQEQKIKKLFQMNNCLDAMEVLNEIEELEKGMFEYVMKRKSNKLMYMKEHLGQKDWNIYQASYIYKLIEEYEKSMYSNQSQIEKNNKGKNEIERLKKFFVAWLCQEKQEVLNEKILLNYKKHLSKGISEKSSECEDFNSDKIYYYENKFRASAFQGQLSKYVFEKRKKMELTQMQLSQMSGVDRTMIAKIEKANQATTLETAVKLLSALNMGVAIYPLEKFENDGCSDNIIKNTNANDDTILNTCEHKDTETIEFLDKKNCKNY